MWDIKTYTCVQVAELEHHYLGHMPDVNRQELPRSSIPGLGIPWFLQRPVLRVLFVGEAGDVWLSSTIIPCQLVDE